MSTPTAAVRPVSLPPQGLLALHRALFRGRAPTEAASLLREVGYEAGEAFFAAFTNELSREGTAADSLPADRFWERLSAFFEELGWGELRWEPLHTGVAALNSADWAEAEGRAGEHYPGCHLTTGLLSDLLTRIADADVAVLETECRARGDQRCCFLFGSPEALGTLYDAMRQEMPTTEALRQLE